jgi:hypothetical protein
LAASKSMAISKLMSAADVITHVLQAGHQYGYHST